MILQECKIANMVAAASPLSMTDGQREVLETLVRSRASEFRQVQRAQVLLLAADGVSNVEIAERCEVSRPTVLAWRKQFETNGLTKFGRVAKGRSRSQGVGSAKAESFDGGPGAEEPFESRCIADQRASGSAPGGA
jgi:transposase-like protein